MKSRGFTTKSEMCHRIWLSDALNIPISSNGGIDLVGDNIGIELKCRYSLYRNGFTIHQYQVDRFRDENPGKELFWAFMLYDLDKSPRKIKEMDIEAAVTDRAVWFYDWNWVRQFPVHNPKTGPYIYIHSNYLDRGENIMLLKNGGMFNVPIGSALEQRLR